MYRVLFAIGCLFGAGGVVGGALGAHLFQARVAAPLYASYSTAVDYLLWHAVALLAIATWGRLAAPNGWYSACAVGLVIGALLFSGGLFGWTINGWQWARSCAPWGGSLLIAAWLGLSVSVMRSKLPRTGG